MDVVVAGTDVKCRTITDIWLSTAKECGIGLDPALVDSIYDAFIHPELEMEPALTRCRQAIQAFAGLWLQLSGILKELESMQARLRGARNQPATTIAANSTFLPGWRPELVPRLEEEIAAFDSRTGSSSTALYLHQDLSCVLSPSLYRALGGRRHPSISSLLFEAKKAVAAARSENSPPSEPDPALTGEPLKPQDEALPETALETSPAPEPDGKAQVTPAETKPQEASSASTPVPSLDAAAEGPRERFDWSLEADVGGSERHMAAEAASGPNL